MKLEIDLIPIGEKFIQIIHNTKDGRSFRINFLDQDQTMITRMEISEFSYETFLIQIWDHDEWTTSFPLHEIEV